MANKRISQLDPLTTSDNDDVIVIVDVSEGTSGETKKQTKGNLLKEVLAIINDHIADTSNPHETDEWTMDYAPSEAVNGSNTVFTLPQSAAQVVVYADGARVKGGGVDYTHTDTTITFAAGRQPYATLSVDYLPA